MSRLPKRDTGTELGDVLVIGGRTSIPDHILGSVEPPTGPFPDPNEPPPPPPSPRDQAIEDLRNSLGSSGELSPEDRQLMRDHGIKLSDLLKPGIYQMEFDTFAVAEHRQWVRVNEDGTSELMSGRPDGNGNLEVVVGEYESHPHGGSGEVAFGGLRIHPQPFADEAVLDVIWNGMVAAADYINNHTFHYNVFLQNSNSVFNTLSVAGGLDDYDTGFALGQGRNLFEVDLNNQPPRLSVGDHSQVSGGGGSDILIGTGAPSEIQGGDGADQITGGSLYDILEGGAGNDTISIFGGVGGGGLGNDTITANGTEGVIIYGDEGADTITGSAHADGIEGGEGDDIIGGGLGDDQIYGWDGDDQLNGGGGVDWIMGEDGLDAINGGDGNDAISGGDGADTLSGGAGDDIIFGGHDENSLGGSESDWIDGGAGNDILYGGVNVDTIYGGDGDDVITGGARGDHLWGGAGADAFRWGWTGDSADPSINPMSPLGIDKVYDFVSGVDKLDMSELDIVLWSPTRIDSLYWWSANGSMFVAWDLMGMGAVNPSGSHSALIELVGVTSLSMSDFLLPKDDLVLVGGNFADNLRGMDGNDVLRGRGGADTLNGGAGSDTADYALAVSAVTARLDTMQATNDGSGSADTLVSIENLTGSAYNDLLIGNGGANVLNGAAGADTLLGLGGDDVLIGGAGVANQLQGGLGDDVYVLEANDTVVELAGEGTDTVQTVRTSYTLGANVENLTYTGASAFVGAGNALANAITGGSAADSLSGGAGNDVLTGGKGNDVLKGGDGSDTIVLTGLQGEYAFSTVSGGYQVTDSEAGRDGVDSLNGIEFVRFGDGSTVSVSSLVPYVSPALSGKDAGDDPFILPDDLDSFVVSKFSDEPLVLPHEQDLGFDAGLIPPDHPFAGDLQRVLHDGGLDLPAGGVEFWHPARDPFDLFI